METKTTKFIMFNGETCVKQILFTADGDLKSTLVASVLLNRAFPN